LEDVAFVLAIGIDKGEHAPRRYTLQIAVPALIAQGRGGGGGGPGVITEVIEGRTLTEAANLLATMRHKRISFEHEKIIIFGKELAQDGILVFVGELVRDRQFRRTNYLLVSTGTAGDILQGLQTERDPAGAIAELVRLASNTGLAPATTVHEWLIAYETVGGEPVAPIIGPPRDVAESGLEMGQSGGGAAGGEGGTGHASGGGAVTPPKLQVMGTAVFYGDRLVDFLSGEQTQVYLLMVGKMSRSVFTFQMQDPEAVVSIAVRGEQPKMKAAMEGDMPSISERIVFEGDITKFLYRGQFLTKESDLKKVTEQLDHRLKGIADDLVARMQGLGTDIFGFGHSFRYRAKSFDEWIRTNWPAQFVRAKVNLEVRSFVRRTGTTLSPLEELPIYRHPEGGGGSSGP
jgi:spore germination protein KC